MTARVLASPRARALARESGVDLAELQGSGPGGRIVAADVIPPVQNAGLTDLPETKPAAVNQITLGKDVRIDRAQEVLRQLRQAWQGDERHLDLASLATLALLRSLREKDIPAPDCCITRGASQAHLVVASDVSLQTIMAARIDSGHTTRARVHVNDLGALGLDFADLPLPSEASALLCLGARRFQVEDVESKVVIPCANLRLIVLPDAMPLSVAAGVLTSTVRHLETPVALLA